MKKKSTFVWFVISVVCLALLAPYSGKSVNAMTVLETDVTTASDGCTMLGVYGSYYSQAQDALDRINEIRKEACEAGDVPDPRNPSRMLTSSDYIPIKWSTDLESIARIRAMEAGLAYSFMGTGHSRLNGKGWSTVTYNGVNTYCEDLAYNWGTSMVSGINQWYGEKSDWVNQVSGAVTGHYTSMINPSYTYVGLGDFYTEAAVYPNTLAGEFNSSSQSLDQTMQAALTDVMQKIEVQSSYITEYILEGVDTIYTDKTTTLTPKAVLTNNSNTHKLWVLDSVTYISSDTSVATVSSEGVVTGLKNGTTTITAKKGSSTLATVVITVKCNHAKELQSETLPTCTSTGLKVYSCETCGESIEQVVAVTAHDYSYGEADSDGYRTGTCSVCGDTIQIIPPTTMTLWWRNSTSTSAYYYSYFPTSNPIGSTINCWIDEVDGDSGYRDMVIESTDESVISVPETAVANSSSNRLNVLAPGITTITIYPKYNPSLKRTVVARIGDAESVDFTVADITLSQTAYEYSGAECKPSVIVSYHDTTLKLGTDYTVSYEKNTEIGTATVVITGSGIFTGTVLKNFTIGHENHSYGEWQVITEASCTNEGEKRRDCNNCDDYETEIIAMTNHEIVIDVAVAATCTEEGLTEGSHCSTCGTAIVEQSVVAAKGHTYVDGQCENCGDIIYASINGLTYTILGTDDGSYAVSVAAQEGATLNGTVNIPSTINLNGKVYGVTTIEENAFDGQNAMVSLTVPATVTDIESQAFAQCASLETVTFFGSYAPATADDIFEGTSNVEMIVPEDATGYDALAANSGATLKVEHVHDMAYQEAVAAGCESEGNIVYYVCEECDKVYTDEFGNDEITIEDTIVDATGHIWEPDYTIDIPATATTDGSKSIHCSQCSATKAQTVIPATGSDGDDNDNPPNENDGNNDTPSGGDDSEGNDIIAGGDNDENDGAYLAIGSTFKVNGITYQVVESDAGEQEFAVACVKTSSKKIRSFKMPATVLYNDVSYRVVSVGKNAFSGCKELKTLTLGSNVTTIGDKAFYKCTALTKITIPSKVTKIGEQAFARCKKLKTVTIKSKKLKASRIGKNAFKGIKSNATIKVPKKKLKTYKAILRKKGVGSKAKFKKL